MKENLHIIQKQFVDLTVSRRENSLVLQQQFERMLEEKILPRLEPVFDGLAGPEEWIELDKLEVNLGRLHPLQRELWLEKTFQEITSAVKEAVNQSKSNISTTPLAWQEIILFFLRQGYLPWWAVEIKVEATVQKLMEANPKKLLSCLQESQPRKRWVKQFGEEIQKTFLKSLGVPPPFLYAAWKSLVIVHFEPLFSGNQLPERTLVDFYWETVWEALQPNGKSTFGAGFPAGLPDHKENKTPSEFDKWILQSETFLSIEANLKPRHQSQDANKPQTVLKKNSESTQSFETNLKARFQEKKVNKAPLPTQKNNLSEGIYVFLAGIVLIHPFLTTFFEKLGLLKEGFFKDEMARERAVHLLYFVATATQHPEEQETVLLKLLCGMDIETPIVRELNLLEQEMNEANDLLESVIFYWKEMDGTSPDELRGSFFVREGKLGQGEMGWALKVEEKSYDILLSKLPWGLSPVKQDWMPQMLWVEWD